MNGRTAKNIRKLVARGAQQPVPLSNSAVSPKNLAVRAEYRKVKANLTKIRTAPKAKLAKNVKPRYKVSRADRIGFTPKDTKAQRRAYKNACVSDNANLHSAPATAAVAGTVAPQ